MLRLMEYINGYCKLVHYIHWNMGQYYIVSCCKMVCYREPTLDVHEVANYLDINTHTDGYIKTNR